MWSSTWRGPTPSIGARAELAHAELAGTELADGAAWFDARGVRRPSITPAHAACPCLPLPACPAGV